MPTRVRKRRPVGPVVALAAVISFGATVGVDAFHRLAHDATAKSTSPAPSTALRIRWGADDVVPAPSAGRICVNGTPAGQVCASYAVGEKPADVLTHQLQALGISVERAD